MIVLRAENRPLWPVNGPGLPWQALAGPGLACPGLPWQQASATGHRGLATALCDLATSLEAQKRWVSGSTLSTKGWSPTWLLGGQNPGLPEIGPKGSGGLLGLPLCPPEPLVGPLVPKGPKNAPGGPLGPLGAHGNPIGPFVGPYVGPRCASPVVRLTVLETVLMQLMILENWHKLRPIHLSIMFLN